MEEHTFEEMLAATEYMDEVEMNDTSNPLFWYLAQIAMFVAQPHVKKRLTVKQFLLKFNITRKASTSEQLSPKERMIRSKAAWLAWAGLSVPIDDRKEE